MKSVQEYRQEKYDKYNSLEEGKLFYCHEKNLDLVNTIAELVYVMQEENPWCKSGGMREMKELANIFPEPVKYHITEKIHKAYVNGIWGSFWDEKNFVRKIVKRILYKNDIKTLLKKEGGIDGEFLEEISCFSYGGILIFFFGDEDRKKVSNDEAMSTGGFISKRAAISGDKYITKSCVVCMPKNPILDHKIVYDHEYQHYLFDVFLSSNYTRSIHVRIIDEVCAKLTDSSWNDEQRTINYMTNYINGFCDIDEIVIDNQTSEGGMLTASITVKKDGKKINNPQQLKDVGTFLMLMPGYVQMAHGLIDMFAAAPQFNMSRDKVIYLLSMTPPHHWTKLLKYYTKLAKHIKENL